MTTQCNRPTYLNDFLIKWRLQIKDVSFYQILVICTAGTSLLLNRSTCLHYNIIQHLIIMITVYGCIDVCMYPIFCVMNGAIWRKLCMNIIMHAALIHIHIFLKKTSISFFPSKWDVMFYICACFTCHVHRTSPVHNRLVSKFWIWDEI